MQARRGWRTEGGWRKEIPPIPSSFPSFCDPGSELMDIWKGWFETVPCRATLATPFPALCPRILRTRFTNYGLRMFWGELMVIWKGWFETVPCRATLNTPFSALCPRILGTRFTNYGLRVSGDLFLEKESTILGDNFAAFWTLSFANPLPPTPFRNLW